MIQSLGTCTTKTFGNFLEIPLNQEYLTLKISPSSLPIKERWRNNSLSADFMADYLTTFLSTEENQEINEYKLLEIKFAVSFIANELLENAMKYCVQTIQYPTTLKMEFQSNEIRIILKNTVNISEAEKFKKFINEFINSEPYEFYVQQLKRNSENQDTEGYQLGLLTIVNDYNAKLGWKFDTIQEEPAILVVTTMTQLEF